MPSEGRGTLARLGRALMDATLLLVALILLLMVVLAVQMRGIVSDARALVDSRAAILDQRLIDARATLDQALARIEVREPATPGAIAPGAETGGAAAAEALREARAALAAPLDGVGPVPLADGLMRQMALTILALAAQEIRSVPPRP